jgi:hypothetical protein
MIIIITPPPRLLPQTMSVACGLVGRVVGFTPKGDPRVAFWTHNTHIFNRAALTALPGKNWGEEGGGEVGSGAGIGIRAVVMMI